MIQEELTMQQQLIRLFYEENCKKPIYVWDQTGGYIPFKGVIRIQMQMFRVCIQIWVKMYLN